MKKQPITKTLFMASVCVYALLYSSAAVADFAKAFQEGQFALGIGKWDLAIAHFTKSIEQNPKFFDAYNGRALAYSKKGEYDKCIADLKKAVELGQESPEPYALMGVVYEIKNDYSAALKAYSEALKRETKAELRKELERRMADAAAKLRTPK